MTKYAVWSVLLVSVAAAVSCKPKVETKETTAFVLSDTMMNRIRFDSVTTQPVRSELTLVGKVVADENRVIQVFPLVGGDVEDVKVELGDFVRKGQTLATIRSGEVADFKRQNTQAQSDLLLAEKKSSGSAGSVRDQTQLAARSDSGPEGGRRGTSRSEPHSGGVPYLWRRQKHRPTR